MMIAKEIMINTIKNQPDDSSYHEILKELAFHRMVIKGLEDSEAGNTVSHLEMGHTIKSWKK
ncbi:MAG: hypothetical protein AABZ14_03195 [Candidatus Margulisiibacteriota bacterium]